VQAQRIFQTAAEAKAVDGCDDRFSEIADFINRPLGMEREIPGPYVIEPVHFLDIGSGNKSFLARSGEDDDFISASCSALSRASIRRMLTS